MGKLTAVAVRALVAKGQPGAHGDGGNLYLRIAGPGSGKWTFRYTRAGKAREMGLGATDTVPLADAREAGQEARKLLRAGIDPIERKRVGEAARKQTPVNSFHDVADLYIRAHAPSWRNAKHAAQWPATLKAYVYPTIGDVPVASVDIGAVMAILEPIWTAKPETATRVRGRIEAVLDYAKARGWREGENPARWRGHLANLLPARGKIARVRHHAALPWAELGAFAAALRSRKGTAALALEFAILTAARTGEVRGATWAEVDLEARIWTVPGDRMKARRDHRVPLSQPALSILLAMRPLRTVERDLIFPSAARARSPLSDMALTAVLRRMGRGDLTVHGFRSTFRDWAAETIGYAREVAEAALAHTLTDKVEAAYRRGDLITKRRRLMEEWGVFCSQSGRELGSVVPLRGSSPT